MFGPVARVFRAVAEMESAPSARFEVPAATPAVPDTPTVGSSGQQNGDVTDAIAPKATPREKADLVEKLNADAKKQRQQEIKRIVHEQAAAILRNRMVSLSSAESAKVSLNELSCKAVVVNGCQVARSNGLRPNVGNFTGWATTNLARMDTGLERKARGIDLSSSPGVQRFVTTNTDTSSLWALRATVVFQFKTWPDVDQNLVGALVRIWRMPTPLPMNSRCQPSVEPAIEPAILVLLA